VGKDEYTLSLMARTNLSRAEYAPRRSVTHSPQVLDDVAEPEGNVSFDVFKEDKSRSANGNSVCDPWPEVSGVVSASLFSGSAEWLARVSATDDVHQSVKFFPREGS
jgi:hypothetical protein